MHGYLSGRCLNGFQADRGKWIHDVEGGGWSTARCGTKPGRLSADGFVPTEEPVTCPRCLKKLAAVT